MRRSLLWSGNRDGALAQGAVRSWHAPQRPAPWRVFPQPSGRIMEIGDPSSEICICIMAIELPVSAVLQRTASRLTVGRRRARYPAYGFSITAVLVALALSHVRCRNPVRNADLRFTEGSHLGILFSNVIVTA